MSHTELSTVVDKFRELDLIFKSGSDLDVVERGYAGKLVHAISTQNDVLECEALKGLGDLYLHKAKTKKHKADNFHKACSMYTELLRYYTSIEEKQVVQHRIRYAEKCTKLVHDQEVLKACATNTGNTILAVSTTLPLHEVKKTSKLKGRGTMPLVQGYTNFLVKAIVEGNKRLEIESLKSLGDVYLEKGIVGKDETAFSKSAGLYRAALDRCEDSDGRETLRHRIKTYQDQLQKGCRALQTGDLDTAERNFAAALKAVHGKVSDSEYLSYGQQWKETEPLCKLSDVYLKRGEQSKDGGDFTKAAALSNAALVRSKVVNKEGIKHTIQEITQSFVKHVLSIEQTVPTDDVEKHKSVLTECRGYVEEEIKRIEQQIDPYSLDDNDPEIMEVEKKRVEANKALFDTIVYQRKLFISDLVDECMGVMGPPTCKYAMIGLGSQATGLVTPYSDLEFAMLIEEETANSLEYFQNLTHYLHLKVINLGETILPAMAIKSLNDVESNNKLDNWFFDSVTPRGFSFDGAMPHACKTPLGRGKTCLLIRTPSHMAKFLEDDVKLHLKKGYHLASVLGTVSLITGEQGLVDKYTVAWNHQLKKNGSEIARLLANTMLMENTKTFEMQDPTSRMLNVKKEVYRFSSLAVSCWALLCDIQPTTIWETIQAMYKKGAISDKNAHHLMVLVSISAELRLRTYMNNRGQVENMSVLSSMSVNDDIEEKTKRIFHLSNVKQLMRYYYTATPLKNFVPQLSNGQPVEEPSILFDNSLILQADVYQSLCDYNQSKTCLEHELQTVHIKYGTGGIHPYIAELLAKMGNAWDNLGDVRKAVDYHQQSLQMEWSIYGKGKAHHNIASSLNGLGDAWRNLGDHRKAVSYYEQALEMMRCIYGEGNAHQHIAVLLNNLGAAWKYLGDHRKAVSYHEQALEMMRSIYGEGNAHSDIALSLNNLGVAWSNLGDYRKADSYYEQALEMRRSIYGEGNAHPDIASSLNNLGYAWSDLGDHRKAVSYHEQALEMRRSIYGEGNAHPDIASSLNNLGTAWRNLGDHRKAVSYHEQTLEMMRSIYGEGNAHPNIASSLNNLGTAWSDLGDHRKSVSYHEQTLEMRRSIYGEGNAHPDIASSLNNLGYAWSDLGDHRKAVSYHEQALEMRRSIYGEGNAHPDIASSLNNLGNVWGGLGDYRKAVSYHEQALEMRRSIYGAGNAHPNIASSLNNLGNAWSDLSDYRKALSYYEQALQMRRSIYGEGKAHPHIASSFNNLGNAWSDLGDHRKAVNYHEQALEMRRSIYGEDSAHPDIADSLGNLCVVWRDFGDRRKATSYYAQFTRIKQMIDGTYRP
ncbi:hypothetical protein Bbelb_074530 [Branchiostoma belcheri]|nr:hypothetical protein Bbelb_074530 [Branchiostoma belcheri]